MTTHIWIDTQTGTWGSNPEKIVLVSASEDDLEFLEGASDGEIIRFGKECLTGDRKAARA